MKKQFLAMLSAVAVAGTVITVPLVSSQADEENEEIFSATSDNYQSLITDDTIRQLGTHGDPSVDPYGGPGRTPCILAKSNYDALEGIQIKLDDVHVGDVLSAKFQLSSTDANRDLKVELKQGESSIEMLNEKVETAREWKLYETTTSATVSGEDDVYLCIEHKSGEFWVADIKVYKKSGETEPATPTDTPTPTAEPTEEPTEKPPLTYTKAFFETNGSLDGDLTGATLSEDGHVIKSADRTSVVSAWKCVFTGAAPGGLDVTATSGENSGSAYVGKTDTTIDGPVTFYVLVNSAASDIKFEATVHQVE